MNISDMQTLEKRFTNLIRRGAGVVDIHSGGCKFIEANSISNEFVQRELDRVNLHRSSLCSLLENFVSSADNILDVGCSTGGSTIALALSSLYPKRVIGVDPNQLSLDAACIRKEMYPTVADKINFCMISPNCKLPFSDSSRELVVCVSVLEFIPKSEDRQYLIREMFRVTKPGGYIFISTPNPLVFKELHTKRWFGNQRKDNRYPWASSKNFILNNLPECSEIDVRGFRLQQQCLSHNFPVLPKFFNFLTGLMPWQKILLRKGN